MSNQSIFKVLTSVPSENSVVTVLQIDQQNQIFKGHFPDEPVVPGACMLQIVKDILAKTVNTPLRLLKADNIKFLSLVKPEIGTLQLQINYFLTDPEIKVSASLTAGDLVCMKLQANFTRIN